MTNERMEQRLASAVEKTAPDDVNGVLSRCEMRKGTVINMPNTKTIVELMAMPQLKITPSCPMDFNTVNRPVTTKAMPNINEGIRIANTISMAILVNVLLPLRFRPSPFFISVRASNNVLFFTFRQLQEHTLKG